MAHVWLSPPAAPPRARSAQTPGHPATALAGELCTACTGLRFRGSTGHETQHRQCFLPGCYKPPDLRRAAPERAPALHEEGTAACGSAHTPGTGEAVKWAGTT